MARYINENDLLVKIMDLNLDHVQGDDGRELCQVIQAFPTADVREVMASAWIPVTESLPDEQTKCLISTDTEVVCEAVYRDGLFHCHGVDAKGVLAWMPKPTAPWSPMFSMSPSGEA